MTISKRAYLDGQLNIIEQLKTKVEEISKFSKSDLSKKPGPGKWSALECFAHLNLTYDHYLPRIEKAFDRSKVDHRPQYRGGFMIPKMIKSLLPDERGLISKNMKTFKKTTPTAAVSEEAITLYSYRLSLIEKILEQSEFRNIQSPRVTSLVGPVLRFRLGDAIAFMLAHDIRHIAQALRALG